MADETTTAFTGEPAEEEDDDLVLDDNEGADQVAPAPTGDSPSGVIDEENRVIPPTADPALYDGPPLAAYVYVRAHHNLPGWGLVAARFDDAGNCLNSDESDGWIPNNEEGVHAVEIGFAALIDAPAGENSPKP